MEVANIAKTNDENTKRFWRAIDFFCELKHSSDDEKMIVPKDIEDLVFNIIRISSFVETNSDIARLPVEYVED